MWNADAPEDTREKQSELNLTENLEQTSSTKGISVENKNICRAGNVLLTF